MNKEKALKHYYSLISVAADVLIHSDPNIAIKIALAAQELQKFWSITEEEIKKGEVTE